MGDDSTKWTVAILAMSAVILGAVVLAGSKIDSSSSTTVKSDPAILAIKPNDHITGSKDAARTLIEYGDFQCPACGAIEPSLEKLIAEHGSDVKLIFRNFPLPQHANAELMARAAEAADKQGKYWAMHDRIYHEQATWSTSKDAKGLVDGYAKDLGLNVGQFDIDLFDQSVTDAIETGKQESATMSLQGTPSFFLNGTVLENPKSYDELLKAVTDAK